MDWEAVATCTPACHKAEMGLHVLLKSSCPVVDVNMGGRETVFLEAALMVVYDGQMIRNY